MLVSGKEISLYKEGGVGGDFRKLFSIDKSDIRGFILMTNRTQFYFLSIPMHSVAVVLRRILNPRRAICSAADKRSGFNGFNIKRLGDSIFNLIEDMNLNNGLRKKEII